MYLPFSSDHAYNGTYLAIAVHKVVRDIPHDALVAIMQHALLGAFARPGIICLEGACAAVCARDSVAVVRPYYRVSYQRFRVVETLTAGVLEA